MRVVSVNVGLPRAMTHGGRSFRTGIFKRPVAGRVLAGRTGLEGDGQADLRVHGGPDKAVYAYPWEHYEHWARTLNVASLPFGQFGENLTVEGMLEQTVRIGDRFRVGGALLEVSQPRGPCFKLGARIGRDDFPALFIESLRLGFYMRVVEEGAIAAGDPVTLDRTDAGSMSVGEVGRLHYFGETDPEGLRRAMELPALAASWRRGLEKRLRLSGSGASGAR